MKDSDVGEAACNEMVHDYDIRIVGVNFVRKTSWRLSCSYPTVNVEAKFYSRNLLQVANEYLKKNIYEFRI